jgi:hypothetical protein
MAEPASPDAAAAAAAAVGCGSAFGSGGGGGLCGGLFSPSALALAHAHACTPPAELDLGPERGGDMLLPERGGDMLGPDFRPGEQSPFSGPLDGGPAYPDALGPGGRAGGRVGSPEAEGGGGAWPWGGEWARRAAGGDAGGCDGRGADAGDDDDSDWPAAVGALVPPTLPPLSAAAAAAACCCQSAGSCRRRVPQTQAR